jgi:hypothetical protein
MRRLTILTCALLLPVRLAAAQGAGTHPVRVELDLAGAFVGVAGNVLTDKTVDRLSVERWRPGVSVGVRVREWLEIAAWAKPGMTLRLEEAWGFSGTKDSRAVVDHDTGAIVGVDARAFPFRPGLYGAVGLLHARPTSYAMRVARTGAALRLGDGQYATDLTARWQAPAVTTLSLGLGYSRRTRSGLSVTTGVSVPLRFPTSGAATFTFSEATTVSPADRQAAAGVLQRETFYAPIAFQMGLGWTF